jgi:apoptosis-inducing factor 2
MAWEQVKFKIWIGKLVLQYYLKSVSTWCSALIHRWTYKSLDSAQNIVIIGGSFTGVQQARVLVDCVPTGYKVLLIERNSHFKYVQ